MEGQRIERWKTKKRRSLLITGKRNREMEREGNG